MKFQIMTVAAFGLALTGCTATTSGGGVKVASKSQIENRWIGREAGTFFAKFGPQQSDMPGENNGTIYNWRGGFKTVRIPAKFAAASEGKKGRQTAPERTAYLSCAVKLDVSSQYIIRDITVIGDRPGVNGPSYCTELLGAEDVPQPAALPRP